VQARIRTDLDDAVGDCDCLHSAAALDVLLVDLDPVRGEEELALALGTHRRLRDLHVRVAKRLLGP
jgi:hypothetical protein